MNLLEAHKILQDYFLDHVNEMSAQERKAFFITLLALPLVPESWHEVPETVLLTILK